MERKQDWRRWIVVNLPGLMLLAVVVALVYYAYYVQVLNPYHQTSYSWLRAHWRDISHYSHGPLIPLIAAGLLWWKRGELRRAAVTPHNGGLLVVLAAMAVYYAGVKGGQERIVVISFVLLLYGLALALGGRAVLRTVFFPITFLFLMVPLNFLEERVALPLQHLMAICSAAVLNWLGVATQRIGTGICSTMFQFNVDKPCSGIQSLMALTTVTAAYAYVTQREQWKRWVLFLSAIPLAVLGNMARVILVALIAQIYGQKVAMELHDTVAGYVVFGVALSLMVLVGWLLELPYGRLWSHCMKPVEPQKAAL